MYLEEGVLWLLCITTAGKSIQEIFQPQTNNFKLLLLKKKSGKLKHEVCYFDKY
jgi:hypothetical protein